MVKEKKASPQAARAVITPIKKPRRKYDVDFKREALKLVDTGRSAVDVAKSLGITEQLLYTWRSQRRVEERGTSSELSAELEAMRKRLREVEQERDILKKALNIFSRSG